MSTLAGNPAYDAYIKSPEWAEKRKAKLQQVGYRCQGCSSDERLEVHHLTYVRFGNERLEDLMVLCHLCHAKEHGRSPNVGPVAGPDSDELGRRVRDREALIRHQAAVLEAGSAIALLEQMSALRARLLEHDVLAKRGRDRTRRIERDLDKLIGEIVAPPA